MLIYNANHQPAHRTFLIAHRAPCGQAVRRKDYFLMHPRAMAINRDRRRTFRFAARANRLADHESPTIETRMFPGRHNVAFDAS